MRLIEEKQKILVKYLREKDTYTAKVVKNRMWNKFKEKFEIVHSSILEKQRGKIIGCLVAVNNNVIGWSLINKLDRQWHSWTWEGLGSKEQKEILDKNKRLAYQIAYNRAMIADSMDTDALGEYYLNVPNSIIDEVDEFAERSEKYFK